MEAAAADGLGAAFLAPATQDGGGSARYSIQDAFAASVSRTRMDRGRPPAADVVTPPPNLTELAAHRSPLDLAHVTSRRPMVVAVAVLLLYTLVGVVVFRTALSLTWISALYLAVTTTLTVGARPLLARRARRRPHHPTERACSRRVR